MDALPDAARSFWETDRWGRGTMLPAPSLARSVVTLCIPGFPSQDAKPKEGREEERRGEVTNGFSLRFSGRRASGRLPSHPPSRIARISGIFPPPTITGVDNASNGGGGGALWFFVHFEAIQSVATQAGRATWPRSLSSLSLAVGLWLLHRGGAEEQGHVFCPRRISGLLTIVSAAVIMFGGVLAA